MVSLGKNFRETAEDVIFRWEITRKIGRPNIEELSYAEKILLVEEIEYCLEDLESVVNDWWENRVAEILREKRE